MKKDVDWNILDKFENIQTTENDFVMGSFNEFSEIAFETMMHLDLLLPSTLYEAMELFGMNILRHN